MKDGTHAYPTKDGNWWPFCERDDPRTASPCQPPYQQPGNDHAQNALCWAQSSSYAELNAQFAEQTAPDLLIARATRGQM